MLRQHGPLSTSRARCCDHCLWRTIPSISHQLSMRIRDLVRCPFTSGWHSSAHTKFVMPLRFEKTIRAQRRPRTESQDSLGQFMSCSSDPLQWVYEDPLRQSAVIKAALQAAGACNQAGGDYGFGSRSAFTRSSRIITSKSDNRRNTGSFEMKPVAPEMIAVAA